MRPAGSDRHSHINTITIWMKRSRRIKLPAPVYVLCIRLASVKTWRMRPARRTVSGIRGRGWILHQVAGISDGGVSLRAELQGFDGGRRSTVFYFGCVVEALLVPFFGGLQHNLAQVSHNIYNKKVDVINILCTLNYVYIFGGCVLKNGGCAVMLNKMTNAYVSLNITTVNFISVFEVDFKVKATLSFKIGFSISSVCLKLL